MYNCGKGIILVQTNACKNVLESSTTQYCYKSVILNCYFISFAQQLLFIVNEWNNEGVLIPFEI